MSSAIALLFFSSVISTVDPCADCHSLASCITYYPEKHGETKTSSSCQCSLGLTGDGSYCLGSKTKSLMIYLFD